MLRSIVFFDGFWYSLAYVPTALAILGGVLLGVGLFSARGWQPSCRRCRHDLRGVNDARCPECGSNLAARNAVRAGRRQIRVLPTLTGVLLIGLAIAPFLGATPSGFRSSLAQRLDPREVYRLSLKGDQYAKWIHQRRLTSGDQAYAAMLLNEIIQHLENDPLTGLSDPSIQDLGWLSTRSPFALTDQLRLARALVKRANESEANAATVRDALPFMHFLNEPTVAAEFLGSDGLVAACIQIAVPKRVKKSSPMLVAANWQGMLGLDVNLEPRITALRWRRVGTTEWTALDLNLDDDFDRMPTATIDIEGDVELDVAAAVVVPRSLVAKDSPERTITVQRNATTTLVGAESIQVISARGEDAQAAIEPMLRMMRMRAFGSGVQPKFGFPPARARNRPAEIQYGGTFVLVASGSSTPIGTYYYSTSGGGGGGSTGARQTPKLESNTPFTLRIEPDAKALRERVQDDVAYFDGIIEIDFPGLDQPPTAIRWLEPPTP